MRVWLLHPAEPVPTDGDVRLFRYGALCRMLSAAGHHATQWASTFNHFTKTQRSTAPLSSEVEPGYQLELLPAREYRRHVGLARLRSQQDVATAFTQRASQQRRPDVIVASLPTLELAQAALDYGRQHDVPVIIDVRDLWPDFFLTPVPKLLRPLVRPLLSRFEHQARRICREATALIGVSQGYLDWGLAKAGRAAGPDDRVVHHAYTCPTLTASQKAEFAAKWEPHGVTASRKLRCCYFGTLGRSAGIGLIANAARIACEQGHPEIEFVVCGGGPREQELQRQIQGLPNIQHLGWVNSQEIAWIMSRSDIGLAAYEAEVLQSLPNKPIEYLAGGLPVANTLPGELASLLSEYNCGATFSPQDAAGLARWLIDLGSSPDQTQQLAANAHQLYREQFDAQRVYAEFIDYLAAFAAPAPALLHAA
ncbi:MAG: glycosyltransferase family 4 protein [Planctomycetaceae bacterium]|nr:glycosyltransferase family 4 protein [Planctomycetaceae bacterium]